MYWCSLKRTEAKCLLLWRFKKTNDGNSPNLLEFYYEFRFSLLSSSESTSLGPSFGEKNYDISLDQNLKTFNEDNERVQKEVSYIFLKLLQMESLYLLMWVKTMLPCYIIFIF